MGGNKNVKPKDFMLYEGALEQDGGLDDVLGEFAKMSIVKRQPKQ